MSGPARDPDELRVLVGRVLSGGIVVSGVLLLLGFGGALLVGWSGSLLGRPPTGYRLGDYGRIAAGLADLRPAAIGQLGLVALVLTPVSRVAASLALYALERDRLYVFITGLVLAILLASLVFIR